MEVAKLSGLPNFEVRFVSCNESATKRWLSSELEEIVFSLTHELFMTKHHTVTLKQTELQRLKEQRKERLRIRHERDRATKKLQEEKKSSSETEDYEKQRLVTLIRLKQVMKSYKK